MAGISKDEQATRALEAAIERRGYAEALVTLLKLSGEVGSKQGDGVDWQHLYMKGRRDALHELRASGGLGRSMHGAAVLYCLPDSLVLAYEQLWDAVMVGESGGAMGRSGTEGVGKAAGAPGMALGSENRLQAGGGGKKWKERKVPIALNDRMLELKTAVDKELADLAAVIVRELARYTKPSATQRDSLGNLDTGTQGAGGHTRVVGKCKGTGCGRFLKAGWKFCPMCGAEVGGN